MSVKKQQTGNLEKGQIATWKASAYVGEHFMHADQHACLDMLRTPSLAVSLASSLEHINIRRKINTVLLNNKSRFHDRQNYTSP